MAYEPTTWAKGDVVTAAKLNNLESGVSNSGALVCTAEEVGGVRRLDHTFGEIEAAFKAGRPVLLVIADSSNAMTGYYPDAKLEVADSGDAPYWLQSNSLGWGFAFGAADDYPTEDMD